MFYIPYKRLLIQYFAALFANSTVSWLSLPPFHRMTLFDTPETALTFHQASGSLQLTCGALHLSPDFTRLYQQALETMRHQSVDKLLLDLRRPILPADSETLLLDPLLRTFTAPRARPVFVAVVLSEAQYEQQVSHYLPTHLARPAQVEFNYFTSRRDAAAWLGDN